MNIKILNNLAKVPTYGSESAAGADLYAATDLPIMFSPHETIKIGTGIAIQLPEFIAGLILPRSGIATKKGLRPINTPGLIDPDYRGELLVALHNDTNAIQTIEPGERIAQLVCVPYINMDFTIVDELDKTERGDQGFGSTGAR